MIKISHRGNLKGPDKELENTPDYLKLAISKGYDVEVDLWVIDGKIFLGHDRPTTEVSIDFMLSIKSNSWFHCKNLEALSYLSDMNEGFVFFWHQNDDYTLTSNGYIWTYPGKITNHNSILVVSKNIDLSVFKDIYGVCSDYLEYDIV